jgi:hypothetical protein
MTTSCLWPSSARSAQRTQTSRWGRAAGRRRAAQGRAFRTHCSSSCWAPQRPLHPSPAPQQVGAVIVSPDNIILSIGYNGFPRGCPDGALPWAKKSRSGNVLDTKYPYVRGGVGVGAGG